ncbi:hypothetical protein PsYK624_016280 [Phanerochaete sordida]|uniref:Uncharacterized protein n=1 Tax=Phanerochaete sordida TaxID=48140 RepID=A0A9P3G0N3_9APHY|nr:hypothetical protein PsYK624_016280 [Phanerochaete sordida]
MRHAHREPARRSIQPPTRIPNPAVHAVGPPPPLLSSAPRDRTPVPVPRGVEPGAQARPPAPQAVTVCACRALWNPRDRRHASLGLWRGRAPVRVRAWPRVGSGRARTLPRRVPPRAPAQRAPRCFPAQAPAAQRALAGMRRCPRMAGGPGHTAPRRRRSDRLQAARRAHAGVCTRVSRTRAVQGRARRRAVPLASATAT